MLEVTDYVVPPAHDDKYFAENICKDLYQFCEQQKASAQGLQVMVSKKKMQSVNPLAARRRGGMVKPPLDVVNEMLFHAPMDEAMLRPIPFWSYLGNGMLDVQRFAYVSEVLKAPQSHGHVTYDVTSCVDLIGHLSLVHRSFRRHQAISRFEDLLNSNKGPLLQDYEARVRVLEELGFLEKESRSGCLTRKGKSMFLFPICFTE